jgi:hypothetical protein
MGEAPWRRLDDLLPAWRGIAAMQADCKHKRRSRAVKVLGRHPHPRKRLPPPEGDLALRHAQRRRSDGVNRAAHSFEKLSRFFLTREKLVQRY